MSYDTSGESFGADNWCPEAPEWTTTFDWLDTVMPDAFLASQADVQWAIGPEFEMYLAMQMMEEE